MTRIESGLIHPKLDWCDMQDVVNASLAETSTEIDEDLTHWGRNGQTHVDGILTVYIVARGLQ